MAAPPRTRSQHHRQLQDLRAPQRSQLQHSRTDCRGGSFQGKKEYEQTDTHSPNHEYNRDCYVNHKRGGHDVENDAQNATEIARLEIKPVRWRGRGRLTLHGRDCAHEARHGKQLNGEQWGGGLISTICSPRYSTDPGLCGVVSETDTSYVSAVGAAYEAYRIRRRQRSCRVTFKPRGGKGKA